MTRSPAYLIQSQLALFLALAIAAALAATVA